MKYLLTLIIGVLLGVGIYWFVSQPKTPTPTDAKESIQQTMHEAADSMKNTFDSDKIKDELSRTGQVIREKAKAAGEAVSDAAANAATTATIKTKLLKESNLAALKIDVDSTDGVVTLSGTVSSYDEIATAMKLAWETDGVHKVVSTLQVKP